MENDFLKNIYSAIYKFLDKGLNDQALHHETPLKHIYKIQPYVLM